MANISLKLPVTVLSSPKLHTNRPCLKFSPILSHRLTLSSPPRRFNISASASTIGSNGGVIVKKNYFLYQISSDFSADIQRKLNETGEGSIFEAPDVLSTEAAAYAAAISSNSALTYALNRKYEAKTSRYTGALFMLTLFVVYCVWGCFVEFVNNSFRHCKKAVMKVFAINEKAGVENLKTT